MTVTTQKAFTSSCLFGNVVDDLLVVKEDNVRIGEYSKRVFSFLSVVIITSIIFGGNFIKLINDDFEIVGLNNVGTANGTDSKMGKDYLSGVVCDHIPPCIDIICANMESYANHKTAIETDVIPPWYVSIWMDIGITLTHPNIERRLGNLYCEYVLHE